MAETGLIFTRGIARSLSSRMTTTAARACVSHQPVTRSGSASSGLRISRSGSSSSGLLLNATPSQQCVGSSTRGLSSIVNDSPGSLVGLHIGAAAGVTPFAVPSPMLEPFGAQNRTGTATSTSHNSGSGAGSNASVGAASMASTAADAAAGGGKVEELVDTSSLGATPASPAYAKPTHGYEAVVHMPPKYARREFAELFGGVDKTTTSGMSMVTIALRTRNDMATWSSDIVEERDVLMKEFHTLAVRVVDNLRAAGFWADYIDPATGQAHYAATSSGRFLETDDRLALYGYRVLDYGCCKAVSHPQWGTHVMVGAVFTNAPHEIVKRLAAVITADSPPHVPASQHVPAGTCSGDASTVAASSDFKGTVTTPSK